MNTIFDFHPELSPDQKLDILFKHFNFTDKIDINEDDKPMLVLALNQDDVVTVVMDDGALLVEYNDGPDNE